MFLAFNAVGMGLRTQNDSEIAEAVNVNDVI